MSIPTEQQKRALDNMSQDDLRKQYSSLSTNHHKDILDYIQSRLDSLNVETAMLERSEGDK